MPRGDGSGPMGAGPMSGRGAGYCAGFKQPGYLNPGMGQGFRGGGFGFGGGGGGRGRRNRFWATGLPGWMRFGGGLQAPPVGSSGDAERDMLVRQAEMLQQQLDVLQQRLEALASSTDTVKP
jgi:hypothetical protein